jgi:LmbE family N-acetylglucosaminyl deacetylase
MSCMRTIHAHRARALFGLLAVAVLVTARAPAGSESREFGAFTSADVLVVVAPHPDDESLCCAGAIERARAAGAHVALVWITSGDAFELDAHVVERRLLTTDKNLLELASLRMQEAARVAELLGIPPQERFFLGYPDRGVTKLLHENFDTPYRSPHTGAAAVPYPEALVQGADYTGRNLKRDLTAVIERLKPTWVLAPSPLDEHEDHRATGELVMRVMGALQDPARVRYWIVHGGFEWPRPRGLHPQAALIPPRGARELPWISFALTSSERALKETAIRLYQTQMRLTSSFMLSFVKQNEIYSASPLISALPTAHNTTLAAGNDKFLLADFVPH